MTAPGQHPSTVEELNEALRLYRRTVLTVIALGVLGLPACWGLSILGTWLKPPYGLYIYGESLATWGLIVVVGLLIAQLWWGGRQIGRILSDPVTSAAPAIGVMTAQTVIAQRAHAMGMKWTGFFGDLQPVRKG
ncbi:ABC transporter ATP-binding protein [Methylobacterium sp. C25]|uniref:ABC transporter ATP-binding protein n=1 Tax=Methylobacterium sp. C25 TaxID=2721622 RepID=UPI001F171C61|nr:ABC transporter ATP-binding protein [Methylobacterium sp. C25]MCE4222643.1 ABC transporter ATP-binding protein [Methylobacterium sp. C25]